MIYTIGFSTQSQADFIAKLQHYGVQAVADIRSHPYSKGDWAKQFDRERIQQALAQVGIQYLDYTKTLGARPDNPRYYNSQGQLRFDSYRRTPEFQRGFRDLLSQTQQKTVAVACTENYPWRCHRTGMVSRTMADGGLPVAHIMPNGSLMSNADFEKTLIEGPTVGSEHEKYGLGLHANYDLHRGDGILNEAYEKQNDVIGYQLRSQSAPTKSQPDRGPAR